MAALHAQAQSLGDTARQEEERRQGVKAPARCITNKDLRRATRRRLRRRRRGTPAARSEQGASGADGNADDKTKTAQDATKGDVKDQKYWRDRMKKLRGPAAARPQVYADALQSRINALTTDFVNRDDPAQRGVIATDRQKAIGRT